MLKAIPKAVNQYALDHVDKSKQETVKEMGFSNKQVSQFQRLADNMVKSRKEVKKFVETQKKRNIKRNIEGLSGVSLELDKVYFEYRNKKITETEARTLAYILRTKALTERDRYLDEIERRLLEIESRINEKRY